ncbi:MAG: hypothetical protein ACOZCO_05195 [Bacteroidota bacterium]
MLKDKVHIHSVNVTQVAETISFRIPLPWDLKRITGLFLTENTVLPRIGDSLGKFTKSDFLYATLKVGDLTLKERGKSDMFFVGEVIRNDSTMLYGDFVGLDFYNRPVPVTPTDFYKHEWFKAGTKWEEEMLDLVPCSDFLTGFYRDRFNEFFAVGSAYRVNIYLLYESTIKQKVCARN